MRKIIIGTLLFLFEVSLISFMILFTDISGKTETNNKSVTNKKILFTGIEFYFTKDNYKIKLSSNKSVLDLSKEFLFFPSANGKLFARNKEYSISIGNGRIFLNNNGFLKGNINISSNDKEDKFLIKGKDFWLDFENNLILSYNPIYIRLKNIVLKGGNVKIDIREKKIFVKNGVEGEIFNFNP